MSGPGTKSVSIPAAEWLEFRKFVLERSVRNDTPFAEELKKALINLGDDPDGPWHANEFRIGGEMKAGDHHRFGTEVEAKAKGPSKGGPAASIEFNWPA